MAKLPDPTMPDVSGQPRSENPLADAPAAPPARPPDSLPPAVESMPSGEIIPRDVPVETPKVQEVEKTPTPAPPPERASVNHVKRSPFRFVAPLLGLLAVVGIGFAVYRFVVLPRMQPKTVTLTYWGLWEPATVMQPAISKFEASHPQIKIEYQMQSKQEYRERLQSTLAQGEGPDLVRIHESWMPMLADQLQPAPAEILSLEDFNRTFYPAASSMAIRNGSVMAVPLMVDGLGLYVNNQILSATSSGVPTNWDDLRRVAFDLTIRDERGAIVRSGAAMGTASNVSHWPDILAVLMLQNSVDLSRPDALVDAQGRNLGADALRYYTMFSTQDRTWDESMPTDIVAFANGKVAMILAPSWEAFEIRSLNPNLDFSIHPIPQLSSQRRVTWANEWLEAVSKHSKYPTQAWEFLKFLTSQEGEQVTYTEQSKIRAFGEPYSRRDMADLLKDAPFVGPYVEQAPDAKSWYMNSGTDDNGINSEINAYYRDAINAILTKKETPESAIATAAKGVNQVLKKYGVK